MKLTFELYVRKLPEWLRYLAFENVLAESFATRFAHVLETKAFEPLWEARVVGVEWHPTYATPLQYDGEPSKGDHVLWSSFGFSVVTPEKNKTEVVDSIRVLVGMLFPDEFELVETD